MGEQRVRAWQDAEQQRFFTRCLLRDLEALEVMLQQGAIESDTRRVGAEQELFLVDAGLRAAPRALEVLGRVDDSHFTTELALYNLEFNLDPFAFRGDCLARMHAEIDTLLAQVRTAATELGVDVVLTGILPTLRLEDVNLGNMTPNPRYRAINEALSRLRGGAFRFRIKGMDELRLEHDNMMLESCNTSFQVHLQVTAEQFAHYYNIAQLVAAPVLAVAANSPLLFGRRLWRETRLALFQQSIDTRVEDLDERELRPRVSFGSRWVRDSVLDIYQEDVARYRALLGAEDYEDPFAALDEGRPPHLTALRLHAGTIYRWNRACYGISDGRPHLRIENRILPAGPTPADEVANAAFWFGLMHGLAEQVEDVPARMDFDVARSNLLAAARLGLDAQITWLHGRAVPAERLVLDELLPLARQSLLEQGLDRGDVEHYLGIVAERVHSGRTGACWQIRSLEEMKKQPGASLQQALAALVAASIREQREGARPGHEWPLARLEDAGAAFGVHYGTVASFMTRDLFTVHEDELVDLAASVMDWKHIRHVPVEDDQHRLVGLITHRTLLRFFSRVSPEERSVPVSRLMARDPLTVTPDTPTLEAIARMKEHHVSCLPVVRPEGRLVGIVTEQDFMDIAAVLLEQKLREARP